MTEASFKSDLEKLLSRYGSVSNRELADELGNIIPIDCRKGKLGESVMAALGDKELSEDDADKIAVLEAAFDMPCRAV